MKSKLSALIITAVFLLSGISVSAESNDSVSEVMSLADGIVNYKLNESGETSVQEWINGYLTEKAGNSSEWYIFTLSRVGDYDFSAYEEALLRYLSENNVRSAVSRQKYALSLLAAGSKDSFIQNTADDSIGEMGVMSYVYGLHLLNNGAESKTHNKEEVVDTLLSLQLSDGGWALNGGVGDNDITAMTVQSLTPYYEEDEKVRTAVDKALSLLSERQLENGEYSSYGIPNAESTAQVLTALSGLGIDAYKDERFIKNGKTVIDGLLTFRLDDGSFSHEAGKAMSENATVQAYYSLISYKLMSDGKGGLYVLGKSETPPENEEAVTTTPETEAPETEESESGEDTAKNEPISYKVWAIIAIIAVGGVVCVILLIIGKRNAKNFIAVLIIALLLCAFVLLTDFKATSDYYGGETIKKEDPIGSATISIRCDTIVGKSDKEYIPEDGNIVFDTFEIEAEETVYDILIEASKKHSLQLEHSGTGDMTYISGINYIYEFDFGDLSGWMYFVNGESPSVGCQKYELKDGDRIEWLYSCEMGNDLE